MAHYFISRHIGAVQWFKQQGIEIKQYYPHCSDISIFKKDDVVYGNLPIHLVGILTKHGARYFNLVLDVPSQLRGKELSGADFEKCNPRFIEYKVFAKNTMDVVK
jgi:CRISPR-associated protein Csx16